MAFLDFLNDPRRRLLAEQGLAGPDLTNLAPPSPTLTGGSGGGPMSDAPARPPSLPWNPGAVMAMGGDVPPETTPKIPTTAPTFPTAMPGVSGRRDPNLPDISPRPPAPGARPIQPMLGPSMAGTGPGPAIEPMAPPTQYERLEAARQAAERSTPSRKKSALLGVLSGVAQGLGSGQGLGGALGGALAGGIYGAADPKGLRMRQFEAREKPKLLERFAYEDQEKAQRAAAAKAALDAGMTQAQIANIQSQMDSRAAADALAGRKQTSEENKPLIVAPGASVIRPGDKAPVFTAPPRPTPEKAPTAAELRVDPDDGSSVEVKARASYEARGGDAYVLSKMPKRQQDLINGAIADASPAEVAAADRAYQNAINKQWQSDLSYTEGEIRSKVLRARQGKQAQRPAATQRKGQSGRRIISVDEGDALLQ